MKGSRKTFAIVFLLIFLLAPAGPAAAVEDAPDWVSDGLDKGGEYGSAVAAGDFNGDGYADLVVGGPRCQDEIYREGLAELYYGTPAGLEPTPRWHTAGGLKGAEYGSAVASGGDVNGDGYDDLLVGAPRFNSAISTQPEEGAAYLYPGAPGGPSATPGWRFEGAAAYAQVGAAVASAGDVNGDGYDDVLIGAPLYPNDAANQGKAFLFYGSENGLRTVEDWSFVSHQIGSVLGGSLGSAGDVNGDGYGDFFIGAPSFDGRYINEGAVFIFHGSPQGPGDVPVRTLTGGTAGGYFGKSAAGPGDVDGDGYGDLLVGAPYYDNGLYGDGAAFLYRGSASGLASAPVWKGYIRQTGSAYGNTVAAAGDLNNDGFADVLVGAHRYSDDQGMEGGTFAYLGGPSGLASAPAWTLTGDKADTYFGYALSAGDLNADGFPDLAVGAPQYRLAEVIVGRAAAFHGKEGLQTTYRIYTPAVLR